MNERRYVLTLEQAYWWVAKAQADAMGMLDGMHESFTNKAFWAWKIPGPSYQWTDENLWEFAYRLWMPHPWEIWVQDNFGQPSHRLFYSGMDGLYNNLYSKVLSQAKGRARGTWRGTDGSLNKMLIRVPHR